MTNIRKSPSLWKMRWRKFKTLRRGYFSFWTIVLAYGLSFLLPLFMSGTALLVRFDGGFYLPWWKFCPGTEFGLANTGEPNWRRLQKQFQAEDGGNWIWMPLYPYGPNENVLDDMGEGVNPPTPPDWEHWMGTDGVGRDVFARLAYGFQTGMTFAVLALLASYSIGIAIGAMCGYFGGWFDLLVQRFIEIWSSLPFLLTVMIVTSIISPSLIMLLIMIVIFAWMGISAYIRGEFLREKNKDYVAAAVAQGEGDFSIIFRQILPNALTPIVTFAPFALVGFINALVGLDFLGYGLPIPTPSWGELMGQGLRYLDKWWLITFPVAAEFFTLLLVVFVGEGIREAFDPKVFSRLR